MPLSCVIAARLALYTVCEHQHCPVLYQCPWHPERSLGTPSRRLLEIVLPSNCPRSETPEFVSSVTLLANVFFFRRQSTDLILFELGDQHKSFGFGLFYPTAGLPRLFPCTVASGFSPSWFHRWLRWVLRFDRTTCTCDFCDWRWSCIEQNFSLRFVLVKFHNFTSASDGTVL